MTHWGAHIWEAVAIYVGQAETGDATAILYRCQKCDEVKSRVIQGRWTIEQIKGTKS